MTTYRSLASFGPSADSAMHAAAVAPKRPLGGAIENPLRSEQLSSVERPMT